MSGAIATLSNRWVEVSQQEKKKAQVLDRLDSVRQTAPFPPSSVGLIDPTHTRNQRRRAASRPAPEPPRWCVYGTAAPRFSSEPSRTGTAVRGAQHLDHLWTICRCWNSGGESSSISTDCRSYTGTWKVSTPRGHTIIHTFRASW